MVQSQTENMCIYFNHHAMSSSTRVPVTALKLVSMDLSKINEYLDIFHLPETTVLEDLWVVFLESPSSIYAKNLFTRKAYGGLTNRVRLLRSALRCNSDIVVLCKGTESLAGRVDQVLIDVAGQRKNSYLKRWFEGSQADTPLFVQPNTIRPREAINIMGEADPSQARPDMIRFDRRTTFFNLREYAFFTGLAFCQEKEVVQKMYGAWIEGVDLRIFDIPGAGDRRYFAFMAVPVENVVHFKKDDMVRISFTDGVDSRLNDLIGHIVDSNVLGSVGDVSLFFTRKWDKDNQVFEHPDPDFQSHDLAKFNTLDEARVAVRDVDPVSVKVKPMVSERQYQRMAAGLQKLERTIKSGRVAEVLTANDVENLEQVDLYSDLTGTEAEICEYVDSFFGRANQEQREAKEMLRRLPGGILLIQGVGGAGKSHFINLAIQPLIFRLPRSGLHNQVLVTVAMNEPTNALAEKIESLARSYRNKNPYAGKPIVVVRVHNPDTEKAIFLRDTDAKRPRDPAARPDIIQDADLSVNLEQLVAAAIIKRSHDKSVAQRYAGIRDRRVQNLGLSLGAWMIRRAGLGEERHPFSNKAKYADLRSLLLSYADQGPDFPKERATMLTRQINDLRIEVLAGADVVVTTVNMALHPKVYSVYHPTLVCMDEAGRLRRPNLLRRWPCTQVPR